jgi:hypothetical protein
MNMGFDQYHEPPDELPAETRTFARMIASLTEEAEAIGWYEQRLAVEPDAEARSIMADAQGERPSGELPWRRSSSERAASSSTGKRARRRKSARKHSTPVEFPPQSVSPRCCLNNWDLRCD